MKSISFSCAIALLAFAFSARAATVTYTPGTGVLLYPENFFEANSNSIVQAISGAFPGTGSGNASTNVAQGWSALQVFDDVTVLGDMTVPGTLSAAAFSTATPLGFASGGHGGTNVLTAQQNMSLVPDEDVQVFSARLKQLATVSWTSGDVPYFDGSNLTNLATTAAGRTLLTAVNAAAQWSALSSDALQSGAYDQAAWDGVTGKAVTPDQVRDIIQNLAIGSNAITEVTSPLSLSNGVLSINTAGLGGGSGGYTYLATNVGGAFQSRTAGTNWTILSTTVSSNYAPSAAGRFLEGGWSTVISNYSGTSANVYFNISANGTTVFRDAASLNNTMRGVNGALWLVRETDTTASIITLGSQSGPAAIGQGDFGGTAAGAVTISTNVAWNWSTNNTLLVEFQCDTSTSTNDALGARNAWSYLRAEAAASGGGTGDVVGPESSTTNNLAVYADATGKLIADGGVTVANLATEAEVAAGYEPLNANKYQATNGPLTTLATGNGAALTNLNASNLASGTVASNLLPSAIALTTIDAGTITATSVTGNGSGLTNLNGSNIASGTVADARIPTTIARTNAPTLHSPTLNDTVTFEQATLAAHAAVTNFVADPTVSPYQTINADLASSFVTVGFLHATNVAAGRQTTVLVFAGTNAAVTVSLAAQFARNTNSVALTVGQVLPVSFYGYGSSPTNVIATMGTPYTR